MKKSYAILALLFVFAWANSMGNPNPTSTLYVSAIIDFKTATINTTVGPRTFTITGLELTSSDVSVGALSGFSYSTSLAGPYNSSLTLTQAGGAYSQVIYVKFSPSTIASYNGNITVSGGGAVSKVVAAIGRGISSTPTLWGMTSVGGANNNGVMFKYIASSNTYTKVYDMVDENGEQPQAGLTLGNDGNFYGMNLLGGLTLLEGTIFQFNPNTNVYTKKIDMTQSGGDLSFGSMTLALDGNLYGMTYSGGLNGIGVIFQYNPTTNTYTKKINLEAINGFNPYGSLLQASDGNLYGMTAYGGEYNLGVIFQYNPLTNTYIKKHEFNYTDGGYPYGSLIQASDGYLYGMTSTGGMLDKGVIFQYNLATNTYVKKKDLTGIEAGEPSGSLVEVTNGIFYGMGATGGAFNQGSIFKYNLSSDDLSLMIHLDQYGFSPLGDLMLAGDGHLYGMTKSGGVAFAGVIFKYNIAESSQTILYNFDEITGAKPKFGSLLQYDGIEEVSAVTITATSGTPGPSGYPTLKDAFDKINDGTHKGAITVKINSNTTETASAVLNASGSGSSSYAAITIYPTATGLSISGNIEGPLVDLNGADKVTIDGRVNQTGSKDLSLVNTFSLACLGVPASAIRFINSAENNKIKYCNIKASALNSNIGVVFFSTSSAGNGNSGNRIDNCDITMDAYRPFNGVFSKGSSSCLNNNDTISNCNIYNIFRVEESSNAIHITTYSTAWVISGNNFYETSQITPIFSPSYNFIRIDVPSGNNFSITDNYLGGNAPDHTGTCTIHSLYNQTFEGIYMKVGTTTPSSVQNNTIQGIAFSADNHLPFFGIKIVAGNVNIGTSGGNMIGAVGSPITLRAMGGASSYGIYIESSGTVSIQNNTIGSITTISTNNHPYNFYGIYKSAVGGQTNFIHNSIQDIIAQSTPLTSPQSVYGIYSAGTNAVAITENIISNISNANQGLEGIIEGIVTTAGTNTIVNNVVRDMTIANYGKSLNNFASVIGICQTSTTAGQSLSNNTVYNLSNNSPSFGGRVCGIYYMGSSTGTNAVNTNYVYGLSATSDSATICGIMVAGGEGTYSNNIVSLGSDIPKGNPIYGIKVNAFGSPATALNMFFNTVSITGTASGLTANTYAFSNIGNITRAYKNNIFSNSRTGGTAGTHYAVSVSSALGLTMDYNDYYAPGGVLGVFSGTNKENLTDWAFVTAGDSHSKNADPLFPIAADTLATTYLPSEPSLVAALGTGITKDFGGADRSQTAPAMGAWEYAVNDCVSPSFSSHPATSIQLIALNGTATALSVTATAGSGTISNYQWYSNVTAVTTGGTAVGTNSASYTPLTNIAGTLYYYCEVSNSDGCSTMSNVSGGITISTSPTLLSIWTLPTNNSNSAATRIPGNTYRYQRTEYLITAAEMEASGFLSGLDINSISYHIKTAGGTSQIGALKIYLKNTSDLTYSLGSSWDVTGFTTVSDMADWTVPIAVGPYEIPFSGGSAFTYTGGGVYVAWEFSNPSGNLGSTALYAYCNNTLNAQLFGVRSSTSMGSSMTASAFRPTTKFGNNFYTDILQLTNIYTLARNPIPYGAPTPLQVNVKNTSELPATFDVTLTIKDPTNTITRYTATQTVNNLAAYDTIVLDFPAWNPTILEETNITATATASEGETWPANNTLTTPCSVNKNLYSYHHTNEASAGYGYPPTGSGIFAAKFSMNGSGKIAGAKLLIYNWPTNPGNTIYAVVMNSAGVVVDSSAYYTITADDLGTNKSFIFPSPPIFSDEIFYVGLAQMPGTVQSYPMGIFRESSPRRNTFYVFPLTGGIGTPANYMNGVEAIVTSSTCSNPTIAGVIAGEQTICYGAIPEEISSTSLPTGHSGDLEYKWQYSTTDAISDFSDIIPAETNANYIPAALSNTTWYKRIARVNCLIDWNEAAESNVIKITVQAPLTSAISPELTPLCYTEAAETYTASGTGATESYTYLWYKNSVSTGITTATYSPGDTNANATFYCAVTSSSCGTVNTSSITLNGDDTAPVISDCPSDITVSTGAGNPGCTQTATWPVPSATDVCTGVTGFTSSRARGSAFTVGTTTVIYTALDLAGNASTCHFTVTVTDNTLPIISCNPNIITGTDPGANYATVNYICTATDNCATPEMTRLSGLASGSSFPLGTTTISWQATDLAGNTAVCSFTVTVSGLNGNCTVGVGGTFPTLTGVNGLFQTINTYGICGDVTANIISNITEPGIFALNQWVESGVGGYYLYVRPASASEKTLQGNFSLALIRLNGADKVQFDGTSNGDGPYLRFRNNNTLAPTFGIANGSLGVSISNCTIEGSNNTANSGVVTIGTASPNMYNGLMSFMGNVFQPATTPPANYFYVAGTPARPNNMVFIMFNEFKNFKSNGLYVTATGNGSYWYLSGNTFYNDVTANTAQTAINFIPGLTSSNNNISNNNIGGSTNTNTGTWTNSGAVTFKGISVNAANTNINGNSIQNVNLSNTGQLNFMGIELMGGDANITSNVVGSELTENSISMAGLANFFGIRSVSTSTNVGISGNTIANITNTCIAGYPNFYGLYVKGGSITENQLFNIGTSNTTANPAVFGIEVLGINGSIAYCANNMLALKGGNALNPKIFGIQDNGYSATTSLPTGHYAHNSVEISGNATTCSKTYAFQRNYNSVINLANNIFSNKRSNSPVGHYAIASANTTAWTSNNNNLFVSSTKLGVWGTSDKINLAAWKLATGQDAASLNVAPVFVSTTDLHLSPANALPCPQLGWVLYDFDNQPRAFVTTMGAHEINNDPPKLNATPAVASLAVMPNPFRSDLQMIVSVSDNSKASLSIYNMLGAKVADVAEENIPAGSQTYTFDASALPAGMYLCRMVVNCGGKTEVVVKRIVKDE